MNNRLLSVHIRNFMRVRRDWVNILVENPGREDAPVNLIKINAKIEAYRLMWDWNDESVEMPY